MVLLKTFKTAPNLHNCHSQNIIQTLNLQTTFCNSPFLFYTILDLIFSTGKCSGVLFCKFTTWDFVYGGEILIANTHNGKHKHMERSSADYKLANYRYDPGEIRTAESRQTLLLVVEVRFPWLMMALDGRDGC